MKIDEMQQKLVSDLVENFINRLMQDYNKYPEHLTPITYEATKEAIIFICFQLHRSFPMEMVIEKCGEFFMHVSKETLLLLAGRLPIKEDD